MSSNDENRHYVIVPLLSLSFC